MHTSGEDRLQHQPFLQLSDLHDLDLVIFVSGHMAYRHVAIIDLYLHTKFCSNWKNVLWTHLSTEDGHRDCFIRSTRRSSQPKYGHRKNIDHCQCIKTQKPLDW